MEGDPAVVARGLGGAGPQELSAGQQLVQQGGGVVAHAGGQHVGLPGARGDGHTGQLLEHRGHTVHAAEHGGGAAAGTGLQVVPVGQEPCVGGLLHGLDLGAQGGQGPASDPAQHLDVAPLGVQRPARTPDLLAAGPELALGDPVVRGEPLQDLVDHGGTQSERRTGLGRGERSVGAGVPSHHIGQRVGHRLDERHRDAHGQGHAEGIPQPGGVLHGGVLLLPADPHLQGTAVRHEPVQVALGHLHRGVRQSLR